MNVRNLVFLIFLSSSTNDIGSTVSGLTTASLLSMGWCELKEQYVWTSSVSFSKQNSRSSYRTEPREDNIHDERTNLTT